MRNKSHGLKENDTLTYIDYLDNVNAEMSPDTAPTLIPVLDGDNVVMKSFAELSGKSGEVLEDAQDISKAIATLDIEHWFIHKGEHFFNSQCLEIPSNTTWNWVIETGDRGLHMIFEITANNGALFFDTYEGITADSNGTLQTLLNNNRLSSKTSTATMRLNPTNISIVGAQRIRCGRLGVAGNVSQRVGGSINRSNEIVFKKNTKYLLRMQNLVNEINYTNLTHSWYENGL
jgi:hypothetical protein